LGISLIFKHLTGVQKLMAMIIYGSAIITVHWGKGGNYCLIAGAAFTEVEDSFFKTTAGIICERDGFAGFKM